MLKPGMSLAVIAAACLATGAMAMFAVLQFMNNDAQTASNSTNATVPVNNIARTNRNNNGPWASNLYLTSGTSLDALSEAQLFVESAGVPSIAQTDDGSLIAAFQWFPEDNQEAFDKIATSTSQDGGLTWSDPVSITVENYPEVNQRPFDPTIVNAGDGTLRLYFSSSPGKTTRSIHSATSTDGIAFVYEGENLSESGTELYDSAVINLNETWHMITPWAPDLGAYHGTSSDGLLFTMQEKITDEASLNWTGNLTVVDDLAYFFGTGISSNGFQPWYRTTSDMMSWSEPIELDIDRGSDPAALYVPDQGWIIIYVAPAT